MPHVRIGSSQQYVATKMLNPKTQCFSTEVFSKRVTQYSRGKISQEELITNFLGSFNPDLLIECINMLDTETRDRIRMIIEPSPKTEDEWVNLRKAHQTEADEAYRKLGFQLPLCHGERWFIVDLDWAWHLLRPRLILRRYEVYALRRAFDLPTHEGDWGHWCARNAQQISRTALNPWIFKNRTRYYAYLSSGRIPHGRYKNCPSPENPSLSAEQHSNSPTAINLLARLRLIEDNHPNYFFMIRRRLLEQLHQAWGVRHR